MLSSFRPGFQTYDTAFQTYDTGLHVQRMATSLKPCIVVEVYNKGFDGYVHAHRIHGFPLKLIFINCMISVASSVQNVYLSVSMGSATGHSGFVSALMDLLEWTATV